MTAQDDRKKADQARIVLHHLQKAMLAEKKLEFTNTGVFGGFSNFLLGIIPRLRQLGMIKNEEARLSEAAARYAQMSKGQRQTAWHSLSQIVAALAAEAEGERREQVSAVLPELPESSESPEPLAPDPEAQRAKSQGQSQSQNPSQTQPRKTSPTQAGDPSRSLQYVKGVGPERLKILKQLGINSIEDLLLYFPRRYENRQLRAIEQLREGELASVAGKVVAAQSSQGKIKTVKLSIESGGRLLWALWFNQSYILKQYPAGSQVVVTGKVRWQNPIPEMLAVDIEKQGKALSDHKIMPVYPETAKLSSKVIRALVQEVIQETGDYFPEILPPEAAGEWMERSLAYQRIHFPQGMEELALARERIVWEEILFLQLAFARLRGQTKQADSPVLAGGKGRLQPFIAALPFALTAAQRRVMKEILEDMASPKGMTRLVQGDVGSGKTVIAMIALLQAADSGYQGAMMAPTEILAAQHFHSLTKAFTPLGVTVVQLSGSQGKGEREAVLAQIEDGGADVVVGTHAVIQEQVKFCRLGLAITDEQHRFGVRQRTELQNKGKNPHVLVMTATPIPRTLALTLYGDLQLSVIDELPAGRKPVLTRKLSEKGRPQLETFLEQQIGQGRQVYVVCPLVEESEKLDLASATERAEALRRRYPERQIALLHGRLKRNEKDQIMLDFVQGGIDILVATTVIEVGINVPNAAVMVIEGAERFGLAQLHQLRGRVGRGADQSFCILMAGSRESRRLDILCQTRDGFKIAEEDLRLRGPGELLGVRQHGLPELRLADLSRDGQLVEKAYQTLQAVGRNPERYAELLREADRKYAASQIGVH